MKRSDGSSRRSAGRRSLLAALLLVWLTPPALAEERREEAVGAAPITSDEAQAGVDAVGAAVRSAVLRTARSLLREDFVPPSGGGSPGDWLETQLGDDPFAYASRFSILEDRGRRRATFSDDPDVEYEYVVLAEVFVDVDGIRERLEGLGALGRAGRGRSGEVTLVIEGLQSYRPLAALRDELGRDAAVSSVVPVEFTRGRAVLAVRGRRSAQELVEALKRGSPEGLRVVPVEVGPRTATLLVDWREPAPSASD